VKSLARSAVTAPSLDDHGIRGEVVFIDMPYGNVITDISGDELGKLGYKLGDTIRVKLGTAESGIPFVKAYSEVAPTKPLLYVDPRGGYVALAINEGNFGSTYGVTVEKTVAIAKK
jgi:S-adenosylmethionine hydrolase